MRAWLGGALALGLLALPAPALAQGVDPYLGLPCNVPSDCGMYGLCVQGVCCTSDCTEACGTCLAAEGAEMEGHCSAIPAGSPGKTDCGELTCNGTDLDCSFCHGDETCVAGRYCARGKEVCQTPERCETEDICRPLKELGDACDPDTDCGGYRMGEACNPCESGFCIDGVCCDRACAPDEACSAALKASGDDGTCGGAKGATDGSPCEEDEACTSGHCIDGVCCNRECNAAEACSEALKVSGADGSCGEAKTAIAGADCTSEETCTSGYCVDGVCCNTRCDELCEACTAGLKGSGDDGRCGVIEAGTDPENECDDDGAATCRQNGWCDGRGACDLYADGECQAEVCDDARDCASGFCVDGVCCDSACDGECEACVASKKGGGKDGVCGPAPEGTDPDGECKNQASCEDKPLCDGAGRCRCMAADTGPTCADDGVTLLVDAETERDCSPYLCVGAACLSSCSNASDCVASKRCSAGGECVENAPEDAVTDGGCGCRVARVPDAGALTLSWLLLTLGAAVRRARRRVSVGREW